MTSVILVEKLSKRFGDFTAVDQVSFSVKEGEIVGYLGPNGAGKTTIIRMLLGLLRPSGGQAQVLGLDVVRQSEQLRSHVGYMSQKFSLYHELTAEENMAFYAGVYGVRDRARVNEVLNLVGLSQMKRQRVSALSTGWRQRLALGTVIVHRPELLFLDEPTSGVDPQARRAFWDLIYELTEQGLTALVTTHYMDEAEYCGRVGMMQAGRLLAMDTPSALKAQSLPGPVWDIYAESLLPALSSLQNCTAVYQIRLSGHQLRAITAPSTTVAALQSALNQAGLQEVRLELAEPSLEDVFLVLARQEG